MSSSHHCAIPEEGHLNFQPLICFLFSCVQRFASVQRLAGAPAKVRAGVKNLLAQGIAVEWDIDQRVSNALLQVRFESFLDIAIWNTALLLV